METQSRLSAFFEDEIKDIYWAERHLLKALPKMVKAATSDELAEAFAAHLRETEGHIIRLEEIFDALGKMPVAIKCHAMEGLLQEAESIIHDTATDTMTRDCALIFASQKVEHYEIATYGSLRSVAKLLGYKEVEELLQLTLNEEKEMDRHLTEIAESFVNEEANKE